MQRFQGRNATACYNCHRQKVKCTGEQPCRRCLRSRKDCVYPEAQDSIIAVPETYLRNLDRSLNELTDAIRTQRFRRADVDTSDTLWSHDQRFGKQSRSQSVYTARQNAPDSLVEDSTVEAFIRRLREAVGHHESPKQAIFNRPTMDQENYQGTPIPAREHEEGRSATLLSRESLPLPPYSYASQLVTRAEQEFGDCHTFLRKSFLRRFHATYNGHRSETHDRKWLCRLFLVLALAECTTTTKRPIQLTSNRAVAAASPEEDPPLSKDMLFTGVELFEHGLALLNTSYEHPTVDDVEALNLASHCCYILNRRTSAYAYAGQSVRLAHCLGLDQPAAVSLSNLEREHMKRVWWTAFCVDRMISTELALQPVYIRVGQELDYPDSSTLTAEEKEEFFDADLLTALIKLCKIKGEVVNTVSQLKRKDITGLYQVLRQCLQGLDRCGRELPERVFSGGDSLPESRICSSLALRYHQCYIVLLRPILLHQFTFMLRNEVVIGPSDELYTINNICLQAARSNARIILELAQAGELVKYGYWDSAHLFSSLAIFAVAQSMGNHQSSAFRCTTEDMSRDTDTYRKGRGVLVYMADTGNMASRQHLSMLEEVERHGAVLSALTGPAAASSGNDVLPVPLPSAAGEAAVAAEMELNFEGWATLFSMSDQAASDIDLFSFL